MTHKVPKIALYFVFWLWVLETAHTNHFRNVINWTYYLRKLQAKT